MKADGVAIVGGGLVGSMLGMYLAQAGYPVEIYEKNPDPRAAESNAGRSINLTLCDRGFSALAGIGLEETVRRHCVPAYARIIHTSEGSLIKQQYSHRGDAIYSIGRASLNRLLIEHAEKEYQVRFYFQHRCVALEPATPLLTVEDARTGQIKQAAPRAVFGADGAHSSIRRHLERRGLLTCEEQCWRQGYKEISIPAGDSGWRAEREVLHLWPRGGYMLIAFPNPDGDFTGSLHLPFVGERSFASLCDETEVEQFFAESFPDTIDCLPDAARDFISRPVNRMTTVHVRPWSCEGKTLLVGDAAHAIYPSYGQGANAGFEDCQVLAAMLTGKADWKSVFAQHEQARRPSMDAMAQLCIEHFYELADQAGEPAFHARKHLEQQMAARLPDCYMPLYSMITFTRMPYAHAISAALRQREVLDRLLERDRRLENMSPQELEVLAEGLKRDSHVEMQLAQAELSHGGIHGTGNR